MSQKFTVIKILTHKWQFQLVVDERNVENESSQNEEESEEILKSWFINDGGDDEIHRSDQDNNRDEDGNLTKENHLKKIIISVEQIQHVIDI